MTELEADGSLDQDTILEYADEMVKMMVGRRTKREHAKRMLLLRTALLPSVALVLLKALRSSKLRGGALDILIALTETLQLAAAVGTKTFGR